MNAQRIDIDLRHPFGAFAPTSFWAAVFSPSLGVVGAVTALLASSLWNVSEDTSNFIWGSIVAGGFAISALYAFYRRRRAVSPQALGLKMATARVAQAHGMVYESMTAVPPLLHSAFGPLNGGLILDSVRSTTGDEVRFGTFQRTSAKDQEGWVQDWGFLALRLSRSLPNIQLRSRQTFANDPAGDPTGEQHLSLEGDFDSHFTLYCPKGYETDALAIFTPDLMALLIDEAGDLSVQILDNAIVFYSPRPFDFADPAVVDRLFRIVDLVGAKAQHQTRNYTDKRSTDATAIAPEGRRLERRIPKAPTLVLWYTVHLLIGIGIGLAVLAIVLGPDPTQWAGR
ncbi:MAG: hypothetical protein ABJB03_02615 [Rhodoglobus sp.]